MIDTGASAEGGGGRVDGDAAAASRSDRRIALLLGAGLLASVPALVHPWYVPSGDASLYLATSQSLASGAGYRYLGEPFVVRPPGFSLLLAPWIAARGLDFHTLNLVVALSGLGAALGLFALARPRLGAPLAAGCSVALWLNPGFRGLSNEILSDVPGLALALGCLLLERSARRRPSLARDALLGAAIGLAAYVRSSLLLLLPAIAVARWLERSGAGARNGVAATALRAGLPAVCAIALLLPWSLRDAAVRPEVAVDQTRLHSYATAMWRVDPADPESRRLGPAEILARVPLRALQIADALGSRLQSELKGERWPQGGVPGGRLVMAVLLLAALLRALARRRETPELFAAATLALVLLYFGFGPRLLLPVYALALPALAEALRDGAGRALGPRFGVPAAAVAIGALVAMDFAPRRGWDEIERTHREFTGLARELRARLPEDARLASALGFNYGVYLERPVWSLYPAIARAADPRAAAADALARHGVDHVVLWPAVPRERELIAYFEERFGPGEPVGPALLWRVPATRPERARAVR